MRYFLIPHFYSDSGMIMSIFSLLYSVIGIVVSWNEVSLNMRKRQEYRNGVCES